MLKVFRSLFSGKTEAVESPRPPQGGLVGEDSVQANGVQPFPISSHITYANQFPYLDWEAFRAWAESLPSGDLKDSAWSSCERAWLTRLVEALGSGYALSEGKTALILGSVEQDVARATLGFMDRTLKRIVGVLDGVAAVPKRGKNILIIFDDADSYYKYTSYYYPQPGEFAFSGGMYLHSGRGYFVTIKSDLRAIEPVIAHEMTHACVAHLSLPAWLNEGIAVNTEQKLTSSGTALYTPQQMHRKHQAFWAPREIQEFWSGKSFLRPDEGNMLSYDLARIMVEQMAKDWAAFRSFALAADRMDSGSTASRTHLGADLGEYVCAILDRAECRGWSPNPSSWDSEPEKGSFSK